MITEGKFKFDERLGGTFADEREDASPRGGATPREVRATIVPTIQEGEELEDHVALCGMTTADGTPCQRPVVNARDCGIPHDGNTVVRNTWVS